MAGNRFRVKPAAVIAGTLLLAVGVSGQQGAPKNGEWPKNKGNGAKKPTPPPDKTNPPTAKNPKSPGGGKAATSATAEKTKKRKTPLRSNGGRNLTPAIRPR